MTAQELALTGVNYHYWPDAASVSNNHPWIFLCQRAVITGGVTTLHGRARDAEPAIDRVLGDPLNQSYLPHGRAAVTLEASPTVGACTALP